YSMMSGELLAVEPVRAPRLGVPAAWVSDLDDATARAWDSVAAGVSEVDFPDRAELAQVGLTVLLVEAATLHRDWVKQFPEKYGADVLALLQRGLEVLPVDFEATLLALPRLRERARLAMEGIDALLVPATAIVAPPVSAGLEVRE